jgi:hypothetical protein
MQANCSPKKFISFLLYLDHRPCARRRAGRAHQTGAAMLQNRAYKLARERGFTSFMTREEFTSYNEDDRMRAMGLKY